jgi:translation elongation factor EF-Tu-like GTPase
MYTKNVMIRAKITFVTPDKGGRKTPVRSGTRSEIMVNECFTSCVIRGESDDQIFQFGIEYDVTLDFLFWDRVKDAVHVGMSVQLNEGSRTVGVGTIETIVNQ